MRFSISSIKDVYPRRRFEIALLFIGVLTASLCLLFGTAEAAATLLGSFLGAAAAVIGAAWYTHSERLSNDREISLAIRLLVHGTLDEFDNLIDSFNHTARHPLIPGLLDESRLALNATISDMEELKAHLGTFGAVNITAVLDLQRRLRVLDRAAEVFEGWFVRHLITAGSPSEELVEAVSQVRVASEWLESI